MGSILDKIADDEYFIKCLEQEKTINQIAENVLKIKPDSDEYREMMWIIENKNKIIRNKKLINLLG
jgi:hypothetical protein